MTHQLNENHGVSIDQLCSNIPKGAAVTRHEIHTGVSTDHHLADIQQL